jgi:hypothetical protein
MNRRGETQVAQPIAQLRDDGAPESTRSHDMMSRSTQSSVTGRASAMRRLRRRATAASQPYCATNGCTSYLELDRATGVARCPICGYVRRTH